MFDKKKIEEAVRLFLEGIGEDADREGLKMKSYAPEWAKLRQSICPEHFPVTTKMLL